jgi:hypothetical protein
MKRRLTSMQRKGGERTRAKMAGKLVRIWSGQWSAYWRPPANGYTREIAEAAIYKFEDAWKRSHHCGPEKKIEYHVVATVPPL